MHFICCRPIELRDPNCISRLMADAMVANEPKSMAKAIQLNVETAAKISLVLAMSGYTSEPHCFNIVLKLVLLLLSLQTGYSEDESAYYLVNAPGTIYSGRSYGVVISIFNSLVSCSCEVFLSGRSLDMSIEMHFTPNDPISSYTFELPELKSGNYFLMVKSLRGLEFENTTQLYWHNYKNFIKIQTPKTHYRPGQVLQFRIFFHNETMNSVYPEQKAYVWIEDAMGNRVKVYKNVPVKRGVFQSELRLSQTLNTGRWRICAQNGPNLLEECAYIKVVDHVLPAFYVELSAPSEINLSDNELHITVQAHYSVGTPVVGRLNIQIKSFMHVALEHKPLIMTFKKVLKDGQAAFNVSVRLFEKKMIPDMPLVLKVVANVFEGLTDKMITANRLVTLWDRNVTFEQHVVNAKTPNIIDKFLKTRLARNLISIDYGPERMTQTVIFRLNHTLKFGVCVIMFNGLLLTGSVVFPDASNEFNIKVKFTVKMWPFVHIFLFGMEANSDVLLVAAQTITLPRLDHVHTEITAPSVVSPGERINISINARPNTYVCLAGVDAGAYNLTDWPNNDFTPEYFNLVKYGLQAYVSDDNARYALTPGKLGMVVMTNAATVADTENNLGEAKDRQSKNEPARNISIRSSTPSYLPGAESSKQKLNNFKDMGDNTEDVWIYECLLITKSGWTNITKRVPNTMTSWRLSSFSVDQNAGLTLQAHVPFIKIRSIKPAFMYIRLPKTIKTGEIIRLALKCYNQLGKDLNVTIRITQNPRQFELLDLDNNPYPKAKYFQQEVNLPKTGLSVENIYLRALKPGILYLIFMTITENAKDRMVRQIEVLPDVPIVSHQEARYFTLPVFKPKIEFEMNFPHQEAKHGLSCFVSGNIIGHRLQSISAIEPQDNCEQMISKLLSIYYLWDYGTSKGKLTPYWKQFLEDQLREGFQSIMQLRGRNGGFIYMPYGESSSNSTCSSTWLTAYALELFQLLAKVPIHFDERLLIQSEKFLLNRRQNGTQFMELCETPGRRKLAEVELSIEVFKVLQKSSRTLHLQNSHRWLLSEMEYSLDFHLKAKRNLIFVEWKQPEETQETSWIEHRRNLETAGHTLILYLERNQAPEQAGNIARWIFEKLYGQDSDLYCYECSVAERGFYEYLKTQPANPTELELTSWLNSTTTSQRITINNKNQWAVQPLIYSEYNQTVNFKAEGTGEILVRCSYDYEVNHTDPLYELSVRRIAARMVHIPLRRVDFCVKRYNKDLEYYVGTELQLKLPTGFEFDMQSVQRLRENKYVLQATPLSRNTKLFLTLGKLKPDKLICINVLAKSVQRVQNLQHGTVSATDINSVNAIEVLSYPITFTNSTVV